MNPNNAMGPHVVQGRLFYKLLDGSILSCECIADPYASQIVETHAVLRSALMNARNILKDGGFFYAKEIDKVLQK